MSSAALSECEAICQLLLELEEQGSHNEPHIKLDTHKYVSTSHDFFYT
jgi:hypothetical protein